MEPKKSSDEIIIHTLMNLQGRLLKIGTNVGNHIMTIKTIDNRYYYYQNFPLIKKLSHEHLKFVKRLKHPLLVPHHL
jgi:hypothetical protein